MSPVRDIPSGSEAVQSGIAANKKFRFDKNDTVHEGEGGTAPQGFGETVHEGERNTVPQGDGEAVREGERETVPQEEDQQSLSFEWSSICEFWKSKDSLNSDSSLGGDIKSGASDKVVGIRGILDNSSQGSDLSAGTSGMFLPAREDKK